MIVNYSSERCPLCLGHVKIASAVIAPWISDLSKQPKQLSNYYSCENCDFNWFERFSEPVMRDIYSKYRNNEYFVARNFWEPWFGKRENNAFKTQYASYASNNVAARKRRMEWFFEKHGVRMNELSGCVDFGGDEGQLLPSQISGSKYVVDQSKEVETQNEHAVFVSSIELIPSRSIDLAMLCMVLEHVSDVYETLLALSSVLSFNGYLYIEVPMDRFSISGIHRSNFYRSYLKWLLRHRLIFMCVDFLTGIWRLALKKIPFWGIIKQSEHINYFEASSLQHLLREVGYDVIGIEEDPKSGQGKIKFGTIQLLARQIRCE
jgi:Methyltransferase domain